MGRMSRVGYQCGSGLRQRALKPTCLGDELDVVRTRENQCGYFERGKGRREVHLSTGSRETQRVGEALRVTAPGGDLDVIVGEGAKHGLGEPFIEKGGDASGFNVVRQRFVAFSSRASFRLTPETRRCA